MLANFQASAMFAALCHEIEVSSEASPVSDVLYRVHRHRLPPDYVDVAVNSAAINSDRQLEKQSPSIGAWFPFQNRQEQCKQVVQAFFDIDARRGTSKKREIRVPLCLGMPGIGKSRFAREAVMHLAKLADRALRSGSQATSAASSPVSSPERAMPATENDTSTRPNLAQVSNWIAREVWGKVDERKVNFVCELLHACTSSRNLRLEMFKFGVSSSPMSADLLARMLLVEWVLAYHRSHAISKSTIHRSNLLTFLAKKFPQSVDLTDALELILGWSPPGSSAPAAAATMRPSSGDGVPALIVNLDEAHLLKTDAIQTLLNDLGSEILKGFRLCIIVTGMQQKSLTSAFDKSNVRSTSVHLPLLKEQHVRNIMQSFCPEGAADRCVNNFMAEAAWWVGGVPRYLEFLMFHIATSALQPRGSDGGQNLVTDARQVIWNQMKRMDAEDWKGVFSRVLRPVSRYSWTGKEIDATDGMTLAEMETITVFAVSGVPFRGENPLRPGVKPDFWEQQQRFGRCSLQWRSTHGYTVRVPPCVLSQYFAGAPSRMLGLRPPGFEPYAISASQDNELRTLIAIMCRLRALYHRAASEPALRGFQVPLYEVLGFDSNPAESAGAPGAPADSPLARLLAHKVSLPVLYKLSIAVSNEQISRDNLPDKVRSLMGLDKSGAPLPEEKQHGPIALANGRNAPTFADGLIVFRNAVIMIQEKQSTRARLSAASSAPAGRLRQTVVDAEVTKMRDDVERLREVIPTVPALCLLVSDLEIEASDTLPEYCMPFGAPLLSTLMGDCMARLRAFARAENSATVRSPNQSEVGHKPAPALADSPDRLDAE